MEQRAVGFVMVPAAAAALATAHEALQAFWEAAKYELFDTPPPVVM